MKRISKELFEKGNRKRRQILSICYQLPLELGFTKPDEKQGKRVVDYDRLNEFLKGKKSIYKKPLNFHTPDELSRVIVQFENMLEGYMSK